MARKPIQDEEWMRRQKAVQSLSRTLGRGFKVAHLDKNVRVECRKCRSSRVGATAWDWGQQHTCPGPLPPPKQKRTAPTRNYPDRTCNSVWMTFNNVGRGKRAK